ncbi:glycosaminoglycan xylosylkinase homolog isoform X2 [Plutella xylostella]|uniref:glycosaminoglycan xylosylkinase homolog isoform X2 n=1 Tax=Plutella xylostella TaxID=51655 RepID=UPI00203300BD|nr:glycosaminoglycan xylosylkinase homolog isoform X2 [Plutella xylostella]
MSLNYAFTFSLFLIILVVLNLYFFYTLNGVNKKPTYFNLPKLRSHPLPDVFTEIFEYLNYLPSKYKSRNNKFNLIRSNLISSFNSSVSKNNVWDITDNWINEASLFPHKDGLPGQIIQALRQGEIALVDNAPKGTQLKLLLLLKDKRKIFFKPKRYNLDDIIHGTIYSGFDRHNSEVFAYYLAMALNFTWVAPAAIRRIHVERDVVPVATPGLKRTMLRNGSSLCIYGKCFYCKSNETVCPDKKGELEGAVILYLDKHFRQYKYPWKRSYNTKVQMEWERNNDFCKKVILTLSTRRLLNLIDVSIFDFLLQNGDRHDYEVYRDKVILLDNGKGLGNPTADELDILAPLYQCCSLHQLGSISSC